MRRQSCEGTGRANLQLLSYQSCVLTIFDFKCWDTAGQERFRATVAGYYRGAVGALIVYDISAKKSFENLQRWLDELRAMSDPDIVVMLIGNKVDLEDQREVTTAEGKAFAENNKISFLETSAKTAANVTLAFETLVSEIFYRKAATPTPAPEPEAVAKTAPKQAAPKQTPSDTSKPLDLTQPAPAPARRGCC
jgi:Ras-related protein Rab-11B